MSNDGVGRLGCKRPGRTTSEGHDGDGATRAGPRRNSEGVRSERPAETDRWRGADVDDKQEAANGRRQRRGVDDDGEQRGADIDGEWLVARGSHPRQAARGER